MGRTISTIKGAGLAALLSVLAAPAAATCQMERVDVRSGATVVAFDIEIADEPDERSQGLMFRTEMGAFEGMLFIYERPQPVSFWMRNTLIPLDMLFVDQHGVVQRIHENAIPLDETSIPGGDDILAVLEINGGMSTMLGLEEGAVMRHPAFAANDPAWPCD
ncbi:hypothetical protein FHS89_002459 [Rubricella aquisinus]|uniref:DUF192 domain-containing protein n=1 Tax=Rubricella aquisinus TaxID=2028108 RepID=A0A840WMY3_9RHOB|nr:DUF192 domain-containing protein [Rubricella aquisinus]MBB5516428.1 hypothetical protein [Rubricella aquisinus]